MTRWVLAALGLLLGTVATAAPAPAATATATATATAPPPGPVPVIEAGREADVLALLAPYAPEGPVVEGWTLAGVGIARSEVRLVVRGPGGAEATLRLVHPAAPDAAAPGADRCASFALVRAPADAAAPGAAALTALAAAVCRNDPGGFWRAAAESAAPAVAPGSERAPGGRERGVGGAAAGGVLATTVAWLTDGLLWALAGLVLLLAHLRRLLHGAPRWLPWALAAVVLAGGALRLALSPPALLTAWPYDRIVPLARQVWFGPALALLARAWGEPLWLTDVVFTTDLVLATLTPLTLSAFAWQLFGGAAANSAERSADGPGTARAAAVATLAAAALLAVLPLHLRFSRSDVHFVQSLALAPFVFSLAWAAVADPSRRWRVLATVALAPGAVALFTTRPESVLFWPLLGWLLLRVVPAGPPRGRRLVVAGVLTAAAALAAVHIVTFQASQVGGGFSRETLANLRRALFTLDYNTLVNPWITPPGFLVLAVAGAVLLVRRPGGRAGALLLGAWLGGFFLVHAYVVPFEPRMQTRYHLNLALPLVLLAAPAVAALWRWRRLAVLPVAAYAAAVPFLHPGVIRDVDFDTQREFVLLQRLRDAVPAGCTVLEYTGPAGARLNSRVARVGAAVSPVGGRTSRWTVVETGAAPDAAAGAALSPESAAVLAAPPACLFVYEGLTCWSEKRRDAAFAPACAALHERLRLEPVAMAGPYAPRIYDRNMASGFSDPPLPVEFTLYRAGP